MPVKIIARSQVEKPKHYTAESTYKKSPEWQEVIEILGNGGLKPHEAVEIDCRALPTKSDKGNYACRYFAKITRDEIKRLQAPFRCWCIPAKNVVFIVGN